MMRRFTLFLAPLTLLAGCATMPGEYRLAERDPLEKINRPIWGASQFADRVVLKPVTRGYRAVAPRPVRQGISNLFANLTEPWSFINNVLQGQAKRAGRNLKRFVVNTTIGVGGLFDHASKMGIRPANEDFGQTLGRHGVNGGPYLVLPLLGPSTLRDAVGTGVAFLADPVQIGMRELDINKWYKRGFQAGRVISARSELIESGGDAFLESSLDPYAAARSAYLQSRRAQVLNDEEGDGPGGEPASPPAEAVPTPVGDAGTTPPAGESAAPLPGDDAPTESAAPLPGDEPAPKPQ